MALVDIELQTLVSETDALTTRTPPFFFFFFFVLFVFVYYRSTCIIDDGASRRRTRSARFRDRRADHFVAWTLKLQLV